MGPHHFTLNFAVHAIMKLLEGYDFESVLDIGSGDGEHAKFFRHFGKQVYSVDLEGKADYLGDFTQLTLDRQFDVVWCSHVLEHQRNVGIFLEKLFAALKDDGILAITVPVHPRQRLIAGHITSWNAGLLCYNLILAGFDCREACLLQTNELSLLVRKKRAVLEGPGQPVAAHHRAERLQDLARFFPFPATHDGNAEVLEVNWGDRDYELPPAEHPGEIKIDSKSVELG
ncbi:MAG: class I SAM-dependent methyltransferase [Burkholderiales bacterium]